MDSNFNVKIAISGVSTSISATNMTRVNSTTYTYLFTNNSFDNNGTNTIILSNGKDIVGNILNDVAKNNTFEVDNTAPTNQNVVLAASASVAGGAAVTIASSLNTTNNVWLAAAGTTTFAVNPATMTKALNGLSKIIYAPTATGTYYIYVIDQAGNVSQPSTASITVP